MNFCIRPFIGYILFIIIAYFLSTRKQQVLTTHKKYIIGGILLQIVLVFVMTHIPSVISCIESLAQGVMKLKDATLEGTKFVFGYIGGGEIPFNINTGTSTFIFAFQALPTVILVSLISAVLTYWKIIPYISKIVGAAFKYVFGLRSSIGMVSAAKIFLGQFEAPMLVKGQLASFSESEMFIMISLAFSTSAASLMPIYATAISSVCPDVMTHIIISSVISVVSTLIICQIMMPTNDYSNENEIETQNPYNDFMSAVMKGTSEGANVWWAVVGSLIGMVAFIALINYILALLPNVNGTSLTLQKIVGIIAYPFAWILGISDVDLVKASEIIGTKFVLNETIAFFDIVKTGMTQESITKIIYVITNFGNFACIGMTVGGLAAMCPEQKKVIPSLGWKAFIAGTLATGLTATIMSIFFI